MGSRQSLLESPRYFAYRVRNIAEVDHKVWPGSPQRSDDPRIALVEDRVRCPGGLSRSPRRVEV